MADPTANRSLWRVMDAAYREALAVRPLPTEGYCYAAAIRALVEAKLPEEPRGDLMRDDWARIVMRDERQRLRVDLLAEADRAEAGE